MKFTSWCHVLVTNSVSLWLYFLMETTTTHVRTLAVSGTPWAQSWVLSDNHIFSIFIQNLDYKVGTKWGKRKVYNYFIISHCQSFCDFLYCTLNVYLAVRAPQLKKMERGIFFKKGNPWNPGNLMQQLKGIQ